MEDQLHSLFIEGDNLALAVTCKDNGDYNIVITGGTDPEFKNIEHWSILISDVMDQVCHMYSMETGAPASKIRKNLKRHIALEDGLKDSGRQKRCLPHKATPEKHNIQ